MLIRKTTEKDIPIIDEIYAEAKRFMHDNGNPHQWSGEYPNGEDALDDIRRGIGYVCEDEGEVIAVFAFGTDGEPTYDKIYEGAWLNDKPYAYIHRIAVRRHGKGVVGFCFDECFSRFANLKIDTHRDNLPMQRALKRNGFEYCGIIYLENGEERLAFQRNK